MNTVLPPHSLRYSRTKVLKPRCPCPAAHLPPPCLGTTILPHIFKLIYFALQLHRACALRNYILFSKPAHSLATMNQKGDRGTSAAPLTAGTTPHQSYPSI